MSNVGYVLSIDQASNQAGVSLWFNDVLQSSTALTVPEKKWVYSRRARFLVDALTEWLVKQLGSKSKVQTVVFEGTRAWRVQVMIGAFLTSPIVEAHLFEHSLVYSSSWKKYAADRGATGTFAKIKGLKALSEIGWKDLPETDDEADSILQYLTWKEQRGQKVAWD